MLSIKRMGHEKKLTPRIKKKFFLLALVKLPPEILKNVLELKCLGEKSVLKVSSSMLIRIFFYLAFFDLRGWLKQDYTIIKTDPNIQLSKKTHAQSQQWKH